MIARVEDRGQRTEDRGHSYWNPSIQADNAGRTRDGLQSGDRLLSGADAELRVGNCLPLRKIPLGMEVHNLEMQPGAGGQLCRAAGTSATLTARDSNWAQITLPSGEVRRLPADCRAT